VHNAVSNSSHGKKWVKRKFNLISLCPTTSPVWGAWVLRCSGPSAGFPSGGTGQLFSDLPQESFCQRLLFGYISSSFPAKNELLPWVTGCTWVSGYLGIRNVTTIHMWLTLHHRWQVCRALPFSTPLCIIFQLLSINWPISDEEDPKI